MISTLFFNRLVFSLIKTYTLYPYQMIQWLSSFDLDLNINTIIFKIVLLYQVDLKLSFLLPIKSFCRQRFYLIVSNLSFSLFPIHFYGYLTLQNACISFGQIHILYSYWKRNSYLLNYTSLNILFKSSM